MEYKNLIIEAEEDSKAITVTKDQLIEIKNCDFCIRSGAELAGKAIYLPARINKKPVEWIIALDSAGDLCAVPLTQKK